MENSAKRRPKEVKWGTSASSNAQFLLRSVCVGNREDGRFFGKNHKYYVFCHFVFPPVRHFYFPRMEKED